MRLMGMFIAAIVLSTNANADLKITANGSTIYPLLDDNGFVYAAPINFENVCMQDEEFPDPTIPSSRYIDVVVSNTSPDPDNTGLLSQFTVTMSGNSNEICFWGPCPPMVDDAVCLTELGSIPCEFSIIMEPDHFGKKKKKLNFDAVDNGNDISLTISVIGTSNNPQSALDATCYEGPESSL